MRARINRITRKATRAKASAIRVQEKFGTGQLQEFIAEFVGLKHETLGASRYGNGRALTV